MKYVSLFRGINVGGNKKAPMGELKQLFESLGFKEVKTLLNSGNVVFEAGKTAEEKSLTKSVETAFYRTFGFESRVMVRSKPEMDGLIALDPFKNTEVTKDTRLYVTFLPEKSKSSIPLPYTSAAGDFEILAKTDREIFSVLTLKTGRSVDAMAFLENEFGKDITTRNWNTVVKIAALLAGNS